LAGRHPGDYYGHSVTRPGDRVIPRSHCRTSLARLRRPVRFLECPDRASPLRPGGLPRVHGHPAARAGTGFRRLSGGHRFAPSGNWDSGNPAFAISRGPPGRPSRTPGHDLPVSWHATVPISSRIQVSHQAHGHLLRSAPALRAIQAVRLVAHPCPRCCPPRPPCPPPGTSPSRWH
jgi:hypothetical protein